MAKYIRKGAGYLFDPETKIYKVIDPETGETTQQTEAPVMPEGDMPEGIYPQGIKRVDGRLFEAEEFIGEKYAFVKDKTRLPPAFRPPEALTPQGSIDTLYFSYKMGADAQYHIDMKNAEDDVNLQSAAVASHILNLQRTELWRDKLNKHIELIETNDLLDSNQKEMAVSMIMERSRDPIPMPVIFKPQELSPMEAAMKEFGKPTQGPEGIVYTPEEQEQLTGALKRKDFRAAELIKVKALQKQYKSPQQLQQEEAIAKGEYAKAAEIEEQIVELQQQPKRREVVKQPSMVGVFGPGFERPQKKVWQVYVQNNEGKFGWMDEEQWNKQKEALIEKGWRIIE